VLPAVLDLGCDLHRLDPDPRKALLIRPQLLGAFAGQVDDPPRNERAPVVYAARMTALAV